MARFRDGIENVSEKNKKALIDKDILELSNKIVAFREGSMPEDKFKALRLARGVYGQRQQGVQMIRIKLPFGKVTPVQLRRIATVSDEYSTGNLHITTRQDIQIHFVSLDRTPQLWADLEKDDVTLREACGNTVRNVTASAIAGIDKDEPFDVAPYADLVFRYFLRKPFGQEMGRKIKIAFSSSDKDDALTFMHDFGFIPKIKQEGEKQQKGFKVLVGGGLGAQPFLAKTAYEFLPDTEIISFIEAGLRVFDRNGERNSRNKARLKYLINKIGLEAFMELIEKERKAVQFDYEDDFLLVDQTPVQTESNDKTRLADLIDTAPDETYKTWIKTNVFEQKQTGYLGVYLKIKLGNFSTDQARKLADIVEKYAANDIRFTIDQSILLKYVVAKNLPLLYQEISSIGLADSGWNSVADVTSCPGTDTCNLGISNSTKVAEILEGLIRDEYPELIHEQQIKIKISGCMNSCGQHGMAQIGLHGSSIKTPAGIVPAIQLLLGGGKMGNGDGRIGEKVIKFPGKKIMDVIRNILNDYLSAENDETFNEYYDRKGNRYFYDLLKPLADTTTLGESDYIDWGGEEKYQPAIGVGECAGVMIDLVYTLLLDADEKLAASEESFQQGYYADSIYHSYSAAIHAAKAILIESGIHCNTHAGILADFDKNLGNNFGFNESKTFTSFVTRLNTAYPSPEFAKEYNTAVKGIVKEISYYYQNIKKQNS